MEFSVRDMGAGDRAAWAAMRAELWPEADAATHAVEIDQVLNDPVWRAFLAVDAEGAAVGFAELAIRPYANGCDSRPVPFLEGIWVAPACRRQGVGAALLRQIEAFVAARGFAELGSDAPLDNLTSQAAHRGWGFAETERVVYFRKTLTR